MPKPLQLLPGAAELGLGMHPSLPDRQRVDYNNWTLPPYNRWSFQHVQQLTRTARVPGAVAPQTLPVANQQLENITYTSADGTSGTVDDMLNGTATDGFLVLHKGRVVFEHFANGMQPNTLHLLMSCSKSITSTLAGIAIHAGQLDPLAPVTQYLPELSHTAYAKACVQHLLDMRVGLVFSEEYADLKGHWRDLEISSGWRTPPVDYAHPLDQLGYMQTLTQTETTHGDVFSYKSVLTDTLGLCVERAMNESFISACARLLWEPLGAAHELVAIIDAGGYPAFEGGFNCTLQDFARFGCLIANDGIGPNGTTVIPKAWIDECRFPGIELRQAFSAYADSVRGHAYHNNWWVRDADRGVIMGLGIHGQILYIDPEQEVVIAKFSSLPDHVNSVVLKEQMLAFDAIVSALNG